MPIEYAPMSWNPLRGCRHTLAQCPVVNQCWARNMAKRFHGGNFEPRFCDNCVGVPYHWRKARRVAVGFMGDMFGDWWTSKMIDKWVLQAVRELPQHTFLFLTKNPSRLAEFNPWPDNAWVGASVVADGPMTSALTALAQVKAPVRWLSIEPLMGYITMKSHDMKGIVDWIVLGGWSGQSQQRVKLWWIAEIEAAANRAGIAVWEKNNLAATLGRKLRQNLPHVEGQ